MANNYRIVFTHGDPVPRNIIVDGDVVAGVIDWEQAGWYPEHWEYVKSLFTRMMNMDGEEAEDLLKAAVKENIDMNHKRVRAVDMSLTSQTQYALQLKALVSDQYLYNLEASPSHDVHIRFLERRYADLDV